MTPSTAGRRDSASPPTGAGSSGRSRGRSRHRRRARGRTRPQGEAGRLLEPQERVVRGNEHAVHVAERVPHHVGVSDHLDRLEDQVPGGDLEVVRDPRSSGSSSKANVPSGHAKTLASASWTWVATAISRPLASVVSRQPQEDLAEPPLVPYHDLGGPCQSGLGREPCERASRRAAPRGRSSGS